MLKFNQATKYITQQTKTKKSLNEIMYMQMIQTPEMQGNYSKLPGIKWMMAVGIRRASSQSLK